ncbi:hypothetical protein GGS24DRAFT_264389 [Hypoxylon argillaceum]|nr:hypothetical protein GGS24DRAFT_264389 [Hypoxylon argillaceum]
MTFVYLLPRISFAILTLTTSLPLISLKDIYKWLKIRSIPQRDRIRLSQSSSMIRSAAALLASCTHHSMMCNESSRLGSMLKNKLPRDVHGVGYLPTPLP